MNEADSSTGNGAVQPAPAASSEPQAQGAAPAVDVEAIKAAAAAQARDAVYAELRRNGLLGKEKSKGKEESASAAPPAPDLGQLRKLDRAIARTPQASRLSDAAYARLEKAYIDESPPDAAVWLKDYFDGLGIAPTAAHAANAATPTRSETPVSDGGSPPVSKVSLEDSDILSLSSQDRDHLIKQKGPRWYMTKIAEQNKGKSVRR